ncbi:MAG: glycoside hydrolase family 95 protein [Spirochaetaceae bacterium]|jgi:alpha-L-fucosidase 2|nr:glycoside hydrolase family 95 protein [Spirochaetaceae bacterium]
MVTNVIGFNAPAAQWEEALPLGNGRLGAMVFGIPDRERIQLNEDSIWSGIYRNRNNSAAREALPVIRRLLNEGRVKEAEESCLECFSGVPASQRAYQTAGELLIDFSPNNAASGFGDSRSGTRCGPLLTGTENYRRELDIAQAVHTLSFEYDGTAYKRECFISAPAGILVLRFSAARPDGKPVSGKIAFRASLNRGVFFDRQGNTEDAAFIIRDADIPFCAMIKAVRKGGELRSRGGFLTVENADEALLLVDIRTGFREQDYTAACISSLNRAANIAANNAAEWGSGVTEIWERLLEEHIREYRSWYSRMELKLPGNAETVRYFNFCRYLLVSSSRPGTLPANLQGIWNHHIDPPWGSDYTININTQMNYWPACMCNLAETEQPLFDLLERMYPNGKNTAEIMYGCRGFTAHHNTDVWGDTAPRDYWLPGSYWALGAAWLTLHIWEHYEHTLDREFLARYFYLLKEASIFFADFLVPGKRVNEDGEPCLAASPSLSPENSYLLNGDTCSLCTGCEMDNQILRKLFLVTIRAAEILGITDNDAKVFHSILTRIPAPAIHANGTIREWNDEYEEAEPGHRHFSHLWALCPGDAITVDETPELAAAARKTLERRLAHSGGHTGWSRAWLVNFMARLGDGKAALDNLNALFSEFTLPNLFNNGPPFQIDGNFGALAGIARMLVRSRIRYSESNTMRVLLDLLPALPEKWPSGSVTGLRAKGNLELDLHWQNSRPVSLVIRNNGKTALPVLLRNGNESREMVLEPGETSPLRNSYEGDRKD